MESRSTAPATRPVATSAVYWGLVGTLASFGIAAVMTVGVFAFAAAVILALLGAVLRIDSRGLSGMVVGAAVTPFYIAFLNRSGPGWTCTRTATSTSCGEQLNPWWFVTVGIALVALGTVLLVRRLRPARAFADPPFPAAPDSGGAESP